jgi:outer membrane immunogenic protein
MFKRGRLIGDVFASIGMVLAISGIGLLPIQYLVWLKTDVWPAMHIRTVFNAMDVATPQGLDAVLKLPLSFAMFTIGFVFIWIAAEIYERHARSFRVKSSAAERRPAHSPNRRSWANSTIDNSANQSNCVIPASICSAYVAAIPGQFDTHPSGFIGGGQIGYNYQLTPNWVAGLEADFQGADVKGNASVAPFTTLIPGLGNTVSSFGAGSQRLDWFGTVRGRLGWLPVDPLLVYATGGLAYGHVKTDVSFSDTLLPNNFNGSTTASGSTTRAGWTVGGGLEWMFSPRWSLKAEYLYYDLGDVTLNSALSPIETGSGLVETTVNIQSTAHYAGNIARGGVNYKFW